MIIYCKLCQHKIQSAQPPLEAQSHVLEQMSIHLNQHKEQAAALAETLATSTHLLATYLLIKRFIRIPPEETELLQSFMQNEQLLIEIFGLEPEPAA